MAMPNRPLRFGYIEFGTKRHHVHTGTFCVTSTAAEWRRRETLKLRVTNSVVHNLYLKKFFTELKLNQRHKY